MPRLVSLVLVLVVSSIFVAHASLGISRACPDGASADHRVDVSRTVLANGKSPLPRIFVSGRPYELDAYVVRSMGWASAPAIPFRTQPLAAFVTIVGLDRAALDAVRPLCARVARGHIVWSTLTRSSDVMQRPDLMSYRWISAENGPEWPLGARVSLTLSVQAVDGRYIFDFGSLPIVGSD
jgi:hypothetical protein